MRTMAVSRLAACGLAVAVLWAAAPAAAVSPDISITGAGWGHGIGLSQHGAKAMGADGATYQEIIGRYFTDVSIIPFELAASGTFVANEPAPLWVGLLQDIGTISFSVASGSAGLCFDSPENCPITAVPGETWRFGQQGDGTCAFMRVREGESPYVVDPRGSCEASVRPLTDETVLDIPYKARSYRHGILRLRPTSETDRLHAVYQIGVENFLLGISEVPESWSMAAIEAQVVASRSNALWQVLRRGAESSLDTALRQECNCNLHDDSSDQIYRGWTGEAIHPRWVAAVESTARQVIAFRGSVALGMYSSSSGGWTENYFDVYGSREHPYLASVYDSPAFSDLAGNPHRSWTAGFAQGQLAEAVGLNWVYDVEVIERNQSGSARTVRLHGNRDGWPTAHDISGVEFRNLHSLRSTALNVFVTPMFSDVSTSHPFAGEILGLSELGVTLGCTTDRFCPEDPITRAEMAAFLVRALGLELHTVGDPFSDDDGTFFEEEIETIHHHGITLGCGQNTFCPDQSVTRGQMAGFLARSYSLDGESSDSFVDDNGSVFEPAIEALWTAGITTGCSQSRFCPDRLVTRGEMAAFLIRARQLD
jgi:SpoIID/LytB domain protein